MIAGVPYDAEIAYLESTGTQWIDTAIPNMAKYEFEVAFSNANADTKVFGNQKAYPGYTSLSLYRGKYRGTTVDVIANSFDIVTIDTVTPLLSIKRGGNTYSFSTWFDANPSSMPITEYGTAVPLIGQVVQAQTTGSIDYNGTHIRTWLFEEPYLVEQTMKIRAFRAYDANNVIRQNSVPVRVGSVGYMYDRVSGELFGNAGTGAFVLGPDVATPVMGLRRYPQSRLGKMGARHMIYGGN